MAKLPSRYLSRPRACSSDREPFCTQLSPDIAVARTELDLSDWLSFVGISYFQFFHPAFRALARTFEDCNGKFRNSVAEGHDVVLWRFSEAPGQQLAADRAAAQLLARFRAYIEEMSQSVVTVYAPRAYSGFRIDWLDWHFAQVTKSPCPVCGHATLCTKSRYCYTCQEYRSNRVMQ